MIRSDLWKRNLEAVEQDIATALRRADRKREELRLVVVTKTHSVDILEELLELGLRDIGESYVKEAMEKKIAIRDMGDIYADTQWHMIGHVQSRRAGLVSIYVDWIHSLDSLKVASKYNEAAKTLEKKLKVLIQVNISGEESKYGFAAHTPEQQYRFFEDLQSLQQLTNLDIRGLMTIPPISDDERTTRDVFQRTRQLRDFLEQQSSDLVLPELSMGMSNDFMVAIEEGATMVRIGTRILGPREQ